MSAAAKSPTPPCALDAEQAVLSTIILKPEYFDGVTLRPSDFFNPAHKYIFEALCDLRASGTKIDVVTLKQRLEDTNRLGAVGGSAYMVEVADATPQVAHVGAHAALVAEKSKLRRLIATCQTIAAEAYGDTGPVGTFLDEAEAKVCAIADERDQSGPVHALDALRAAFQSIVDVAEGKTEANPPIPTGLDTLDRALPLRRERVTIVAAGPGIGKTTIALQWTVGATLRGIGALFISMEMPSEHLMRRATFQHAGVDASKFRNPGLVTPAEWGKLTDASKAIGAAPLYIDDAADQNPLTIRASVRRARAMARKAGTDLGLVVIDYLQLVDGRGSGRDTNREQQVSFIARRLKVLSREENVHVIALAQINADSEQQDRRPRMSDIRESKAISMHADNVVLIHAPHALARSERPVDRNYAEPSGEPVVVYIDKFRDGAAGRVDLLFFPGQTRFAVPQRYT